MKIVSLEEFLDWVFAQPDERKVDMHNAYKNDKCGCVMVQYGIHLGVKFTFAAANYLHDADNSCTMTPLAFDEGFRVLRTVGPSAFFDCDNKNFGALKKMILRNLSIPRSSKLTELHKKYSQLQQPQQPQQS